eukprot:INCI1388.2.p1 GENE.INCI1388.2~~INCI1388.2.p1  ORF type:complete len:750 (-),score=96.62 INCI1388.2:682-2739(-)
MARVTSPTKLRLSTLLLVVVVAVLLALCQGKRLPRHHGQLASSHAAASLEPRFVEVHQRVSEEVQVACSGHTTCSKCIAATQASSPCVWCGARQSCMRSDAQKNNGNPILCENQWRSAPAYFDSLNYHNACPAAGENDHNGFWKGLWKTVTFQRKYSRRHIAHSIGMEVEVAEFLLCGKGRNCAPLPPAVKYKTGIWYAGGDASANGAQLTVEIQGSGRRGLEGQTSRTGHPLTAQGKTQFMRAVRHLAMKFTEITDLTLKLARANNNEVVKQMVAFRKDHMGQRGNWNAMLQTPKVRIASCEAKYLNPIKGPNGEKFWIRPPIGNSKIFSTQFKPVTGTSNIDLVEKQWTAAETYSDVPAEDLILGSMQYTATIDIARAGTMLWNHPDFVGERTPYGLRVSLLNLATKQPVPFPEHISRRVSALASAAARNSFWKRKGAKTYLGWLAYYVYAFPEGSAASSSPSCHLQNPKDSTLSFNVRTKFSLIHKWVDAQASTKAKLPQGDALWKLVFKIAHPDYDGRSSLTQDQNVPASWPKLLRTLKCLPEDFEIGGAMPNTRKLKMKSVITSLPAEDKLSETDTALSTLGLQTRGSSVGIVIEFRNHADTLCQCRFSSRHRSVLTCPSTISLWEETASRFFDFFEGFAKSSRTRIQVGKPCEHKTYTNVVQASLTAPHVAQDLDTLCP